MLGDTAGVIAPTLANARLEWRDDKTAFLDSQFDVVTDIRGYGLLAGVDIKPGKTPGTRGTQLQKDLFWKGLHVKFTGDTGIIAPPLIAKREHVDEIVRIMRETLSAIK